MSNDRAVGGLPNREFNSFTSGKNYLFAIGISSYQKFDPLPNAVKDIKDFSQLLTEEYSFEQVQLMMDQDATKDNIVDKLNDLRRIVKQDDRLLIYYSGHGYMDGERGFWIPVDAEPDKVSSYVSNADVHDTIKSIKAKHLLLISDSCFSGSLLTRDVSTKMEGAFEEWDKKPSRFIFISGGGPVSDGKPGENSPFASGIINHLKECDEDTINICKLADQVTQEVRYNYKQQAEVSPLFDAGHKGGQFVFVKKLTESKEWQYALLDDTEGAYITFYNKYPNGKYATEAKQKLKDLALAKEIEEDEKDWQKALGKDSAIYYLQYLEKYPNAKHKTEAQANLKKIEEDDRKGKEEERKMEQKRIFIREKERKEKEEKEKEDPQPIFKRPDAPSLNNEGDKINFDSPPKNKAIGYISLMAFIGLLGWGAYKWYLNSNSIVLPAAIPFEGNEKVASTLYSSFEVGGNVIDAINELNLPGITLTNSRTKQIAMTDDSGHFKMKDNLNGDTIFILENDFYQAISFLIIDSVISNVVKLTEKPRQKVDKTITGNVKDFVKIIPEAFIKVQRNGNTVRINSKYGVKTNNQGNYSLPHVNEGDKLIIEYGQGRKASTIIGRENIYNLVGNKIESSRGNR